MAAFLALVSAICFALAAALQQRGQFRLAQDGSAVQGLAGLFRLVAVPVWLCGTLVLLVGKLGLGFVAFLVQQLSLATGQLAPAMAAVSVSNPAVSVVLGILLFEERLTRPGWHGVVAGAALLAALSGAVLITLYNRETPMPSRPAAADSAVTGETIS